MDEDSSPQLASDTKRHHELPPGDQYTDRRSDIQPADITKLPDTISVQDDIAMLVNPSDVSSAIIPGNNFQENMPDTGNTLRSQDDVVMDNRPGNALTDHSGRTTTTGVGTTLAGHLDGSLLNDIAIDDHPGDAPTTPTSDRPIRVATTRMPQQAGSALQTDNAMDGDDLAHSPNTSTPKSSVRVARPTGLIASPQLAASALQSDTAMDESDRPHSPTKSTPKDSVRVAESTVLIASPQPEASDTAMYDDQGHSPTTPTPLPDLPASTPPASPSLSPAPPSPAQVQLQDFISKRTIPRLRNRTAVQLHPYQMERAHYLTVIRQGRRPVEEEMSLAAEKRVRNLAEDYGAEDQSLVPTETTSMSKPTPEPDENDRLEFFSQFGVGFQSDDETAKERIKVITLERIRINREERKRRKEIRRGRKEFEALLRRRDGVESGDGNDQEVPAAKKRRRVDAVRSAWLQC